MRVICTYGSVRGAAGDRRPYRDASERRDRLLGIVSRRMTKWLNRQKAVVAQLNGVSE